ncbi:HNH endonuclease [Streptomyces sp. NPDC055078]
MSRRTRPRPGSIRGARGRELRQRLAARDGAACFYCRRSFPDLGTATLDHYVPYSWWASNRPCNLVLACEPCNTVKADAFPLGLLLALRSLVRDSLSPADLGVAV